MIEKANLASYHMRDDGTCSISNSLTLNYAIIPRLRCLQ